MKAQICFGGKIQINYLQTGVIIKQISTGANNGMKAAHFHPEKSREVDSVKTTNWPPGTECVVASDTQPNFKLNRYGCDCLEILEQADVSFCCKEDQLKLSCVTANTQLEGQL